MGPTGVHFRLRGPAGLSRCPEYPRIPIRPPRVSEQLRRCRRHHKLERFCNRTYLENLFKRYISKRTYLDKS